MRKILFLLAFWALFSGRAAAQFAYIHCDSTMVLRTGDLARYDSCDIYVDARYFTLSETWVATIRIVAPGATTSNFVGSIDVEFAQADVDAFTGSGATETRIMQNTILQTVADYLGSIAENIHANFTLH